MDAKERVKALVKDEEAINLVRNIVQIPSHWAQEKREKPISDYLLDYFMKAGIDAYQKEVYPGRPNVVAVLHGTGEGKSLMFNGHIDTVPPFGMEDPFGAVIKDGKMYGRGTADMKSGVATMAYAMKLLKDADVKLKGDLVYAGVIDEDAAGSEGTRYIVRNGPLTDLAIVGEPTSLQPVVAHKGCDYFTVTFYGRSVHSSVPWNGANANYAAAEFIRRVENEMIPEWSSKKHPFCSPPTINVGLVQGAAKANMPYLLGESPTFAGIIPDLCKVHIDVRWIPTQTIKGIEEEFRKLAEEVASGREGIRATVEFIDMYRPAMEISPDNILVKSIQSNSKSVLKKEYPIKGETYWGDSGLLCTLAGIPSIMYGPGDIGCAHSDVEWVETGELAKAALIYALTAIDVCGVAE